MVIPQQPIGSPVEHNYATTVLLLGVLSLFCCGITGPMAWVLGRRALNEIDASGGALGGRTQVMVGYVAGIVGTFFMIFFAFLYLLMILGGRG
ncbi:DUF4190 domain-containing protein [Nocardia huaxiensis]|uniref:DUF4190 domain-containing protein n=1 Tax=Nocardia huaxiensis TaxID=2755382 RepID=A0A7D6ZIK8_9NOCA|nr:DUF4190 domain-containing protein [Nocardia huaxiensis]QLY31447.1 DUF4190 domain-containing protein [Nocardia huaxiensis]UFS94996.1 DUF4190 domain-containing protein [Nocardia huaxiensis]